jgi:hypothetical protein
MSIINITVIITDVGMWVTPKRLTDEVLLQTSLELSTFEHQTNKCVSLRCNLNNGDESKKGKAAVLTTNRFSLQAGIKPP